MCAQTRLAGCMGLILASAHAASTLPVAVYTTCIEGQCMHRVINYTYMDLSQIYGLVIDIYQNVCKIDIRTNKMFFCAQTRLAGSRVARRGDSTMDVCTDCECIHGLWKDLYR